MPRRKQQYAACLLSFTLLSGACVFSGSACAPKERIAKQIPMSRATARPSRLKSARPYTINGITYYPVTDAYGYSKVGVASWYGKKFHGRSTASGEIYNMRAMTAAHKTLPLQTMVEVTGLDTGRKVVVRINDRGPFVADRIIDLSYASARRLRIMEKGTARVRVVALARGRPGKRGASPVAVGPAPDFTRGRFWIQVGAFGLSENAERLRGRLLFPKERVRLQPAPAIKGKSLIRVQVGPYSDIRLADEALAAARDQGLMQSFIVAD